MDQLIDRSNDGWIDGTIDRPTNWPNDIIPKHTHTQTRTLTHTRWLIIAYQIFVLKNKKKKNKRKNIICYEDTYRGYTEIYGVLEKKYIGRVVSRAQYDIFYRITPLSVYPADDFPVYL